MVFIETPTFADEREQYLPDEVYARFQRYLASNPGAGDLIQRGHGLRKIRVALQGRGKRGGARVIYFWRVAESQILLIAIYAKSTKVDLTDAELRSLVEAYRGT